MHLALTAKRKRLSLVLVCVLAMLLASILVPLALADPDTTDVSVTVTWNDAEASDDRPADWEFADWFKLYRGNTAADPQPEQTVTQTGPDTYTISYSGLPASEDGTPIDYSIRETIPKGSTYAPAYTAATFPDGTIVNSHTQVATAAVELGASVSLNAGTPGDRSFTAVLSSDSPAPMPDGADPLAQTKTATSGPDGSLSFGKIIYTQAGTYTYRISQVDESAEHPETIYDPSTYLVTVTITEGDDGSLESEVTYEKDDTGDGVATGGDSPDGDDTGDETAPGSTTGDSGEGEQGAEGTGKTDGPTFSNDTTVIDVPVTARWAGGASGKKATVMLTASGTDTGETLELNRDNGWTGSFDGLAKQGDDGQAIVYGVRSVDDNYHATVEPDEGNGFIVVNSPSDETVSIPVSETWTGVEPDESTTLVLTIDGVPSKNTIVLDESCNWQGGFSGYPRYDSAGNEISYGVIERASTWKYSVDESEGGGFVVNNYDENRLATIGNPVTLFALVLIILAVGYALFLVGSRVARRDYI